MRRSTTGWRRTASGRISSRSSTAESLSAAATVRKLIESAARTGTLVEPGVYVPDTLTVNVAKYHFAHGFHEALRDLQDLAGGLLVTAPSMEDWDHPNVGAALRKYLAGSSGSALDRMRLMQLISDLSASDLAGYHAVLAVHAEGSLEAEKIAAVRHFDFEARKVAVRRLAGLASTP